MCWSFYLNEQIFGADKHVPGRYQSRNSALAGKGVVEESLIEALYCFHQNNECSKCEVVHTQRRPPSLKKLFATRRCGFSRHRFAPSELLVGRGWWLDRPNLPALAICLD